MKSTKSTKNTTFTKPNFAYTGEWFNQCPYCGCKAKQDGEWITEDGERYWEWGDTATCQKCDAQWGDTSVNPNGCPVCGVYHSFNITSEDANGIAYWWCENCDTMWSHDADAHIVDATIIEWRE